MEVEELIQLVDLEDLVAEEDNQQIKEQVTHHQLTHHKEIVEDQEQLEWVAEEVELQPLEEQELAILQEVLEDPELQIVFQVQQ